MHIDGACHCGRIRFSAEVDPSRVVVCHCTDCQVMSGAPFRVTVPAPIDSFVLHGEPKRYVKTADSGARRVQAFCPECGTALFSSATENVTQVMIRTGCVTQRAQLQPTLQIWRRSQLPWHGRIEGLPGSQEQQALSAAPPAH